MKRARTKRSALPREADAFKAESRQRIAELAAKGQGQVALAESLALLGIDANGKERPRLVAIKGVRIRD